MSNILENKIIISTRPKGKSKELRNLFEANGATFIEFPMIDIKPCTFNEQIEKEFKNLDTYTHLALTSANAFHIFHDFIIKHKIETGIIKNLKIASIGYKTTQVIQSYGYPVEFDAMAKTGEEFAEKLNRYLAKDKLHKTLWLTGTLSPNTILNTIEPKDSVTRINIYENSYPEIIDKNIVDIIISNRYDMIIVASPSAIINLKNTVNKEDLTIACIGQTTATAAKELGIKPAVIADEPSSNGIYNAVCAHYSDMAGVGS